MNSMLKHLDPWVCMVACPCNEVAGVLEGELKLCCSSFHVQPHAILLACPAQGPYMLSALVASWLGLRSCSHAEQGRLTKEDVDMRMCKTLADMPSDLALEAVEKFAMASLDTVRSKTGFMVSGPWPCLHVQSPMEALKSQHRHPAWQGVWKHLYCSANGVPFLLYKCMLLKHV